MDLSGLKISVLETYTVTCLHKHVTPLIILHSVLNTSTF